MITVEHLSKSYGAFRAVDDVSFTCQPGTVTGFLGPNGAGKSTSMRIMANIGTEVLARMTELNAEYYGQRASKGGLQIAEATDIAEQSRGYPGAPGLYTPEQVAGWRLVTDAVHAKGGVIFVQLWHVGRISHSSMQPGGALPVAPSAIAAPGEQQRAQRREKRCERLPVLREKGLEDGVGHGVGWTARSRHVRLT